MKFGKDTLLEIVAIVQEGITLGQDISQKLREIDVEQDGSGNYLVLTDLYKKLNDRKTDKA